MYDLLQDCSGVNITINAGQLREAIDYCVKETRKELNQQIINANTGIYQTNNV
ncbi:hypothetical protein Barb6_02042 [Bacteroidales bacterium Barb6]|nr:hypothetical protein Barb6_02042 [Bacteroidales bacterium Barb6]